MKIRRRRRKTISATTGYPPRLKCLLVESVGLVLVGFGFYALATTPWYSKGGAVMLVLLGLVIFQRPTEVVRLLDRWVPPPSAGAPEEHLP